MEVKTLNLNDFMEKEVVRTGDIAEVIFGYVEGKPVRLLGFKTEAWRSDFEILELGFYAFKEMQMTCGKGEIW